MDADRSQTDSQFTKDAKVATDNIVAVGLTYQF